MDICKDDKQYIGAIKFLGSLYEDDYLYKIHYLSTDGYRFTYRRDNYDADTWHVEMFKDGKLVHKQMVISKRYNINIDHHQVINTLEALILLQALDPTGLKQRV